MMKTLILATTATIALITGAQAQTAAALIGNNELAHIDLKSGKVMKSVMVSGLPARIAGIDVRPADGMLYALAEDGTIATVDPATGKTSVKVKLETMLPMGTKAAVDFNPAADRLRIIGMDGSSLRANVEDGKVTVDGKTKFKEGDANAAKPAVIAAAAYTNSMKGAKETALYDIDTTGVFAKQMPPNDGILNTMGETGVKDTAPAFDIVTDAAGTNTGWLASGGVLYTIDLNTGKATKSAAIAGLKGDIRDLAVLAN